MFLLRIRRGRARKLGFWLLFPFFFMCEDAEKGDRTMTMQLQFFRDTCHDSSTKGCGEAPHPPRDGPPAALPRVEEFQRPPQRPKRKTCKQHQTNSYIDYYVQDYITIVLS